MGQVLVGLLEAGEDDGDEEEDGVAAEHARVASSPAAVPSGLWERMVAAVDRKFDGDDDGDPRGKG